MISDSTERATPLQSSSRMPDTFLQKLLNRWRRHQLAHLSLSAMQNRLRQRAGLVVLCYHSVRDDLPDYPYAVTCETFRNHLQFLNENFQVLNPQTAYEFLSERQDQNERPKALVTFDDGFADNLVNATPILEEFETPALLFAAKYPVSSRLETFLSEEQLSELAAHPLWTIGAHGTSHLSLTSLQPSDVELDIDECVEWLHTLTGIRPRWFAYPYGRHSSSVLSVVQARFDAAYEVTSNSTVTTGTCRIPRVLITRDHVHETELARTLMGERFVQESVA